MSRSRPHNRGGIIITLLPDSLLSQLSDLISTRMGWHFPSDRWRDLERGIRATAQDLGFADVHACIDWLHSATLTPQHIAILSDHFTVGETYFFREPRALEILTAQILPPLMQARQFGDRHLRIWSAACCTGEEPYSIAMTLATSIPRLAEWQVSIIGTDINPRFLQRAVSGVYTAWSFRSTPDWIKTRYFQPTDDNRFALCQEIRQMVTFLPLNLADDVFPPPVNAAGTIDVIFCRNVFIYFSPERSQTVIRNFHQALSDGGWLIVSPSETAYLTEDSFTPVSFPGIIAHRKKDPSARPHQETQPVPRLASPLAPKTRLMPLSDLIKSAGPLPTAEAKSKERSATAPAPAPLPTPAPTPPVTAPPEPDRYSEAKSLYEQGRYLEVSEKLRNAATGSESALLNQEEMLLLIRACVNQGASDEAIVWCHKAIAEDVLNPRFYYLLATVLLEQDREEEASQALRQTLYLDSKFILAHFTFGNLSLRQKKTREARRHFQNAVVLLRQQHRDTILPESEGLTAGRLSDLIRTMVPE